MSTELLRSAGSEIRLTDRVLHYSRLLKIRMSASFIPIMKLFLTLVTTSCLPLAADVIGIDEFDYPAGSIDTLAGGTGWNYDQIEPGADADASDWGGTATVNATGALVTSDTTALRQYNGPGEGSGVPSEERDGAFRGSGTIYYRVDMTRSSTATWGGISGYDFGGERLFFGVGGTNAATDTVAIGESGIGETVGTTSLVDDQTYTMIAKIDFDGDLVSLWIDPDLSQPEGGNAADVTRAYTGTNWNTAVRAGSGGQVTWDKLAVTTSWSELDFTDDDSDGMPNGYENRFGLNPNLDDSLDDLDSDNINNLTEFQNGTFPNDDDSDDDGYTDDVENGGGIWVSLTQTGTDPLNSDTDGDTLLDGVETNSGTFIDASNTGTDPHLVDTDDDGPSDGTEVLCGTNPLDNTSIPDSGNLDFVGSESFFYNNGPINGQAKGTGFDYDNDLLGNNFLGHTCIESAWTGSATVLAGQLRTENTNAFRALSGSAVSEGAFSTVPGASNREIVYAKVEMTRGSGATWGGLSFYNGVGNELAFFGANNNTGNPGFAIVDQESLPGTNYNELVDPIVLNADETYVVVAKMEYVGTDVVLSLFANPDFTAAEPTPNITATITPPGDVIADHIRLASGVGGPVDWQSLVVTTAWDALATVPADGDSDGMPDAWEVLYSLDRNSDDTAGDPDSDSLTNLQEFMAGTNPQSDDTDGDTLTDGAEVNTHFTDPNLKDSDRDTLRDDEEVVAGADGFITNPNLVDTDMDGENDADEVTFGSDPTDPESTFGGDRTLIGCDDFNSYDGSILDGAAGFGFDYDGSLDNGAFTGHSGTTALWNEEGAGSIVTGGKLITQDGGASREFNGPLEGAAANQDERYGAVNESFTTNVVYMKVQMTRREGAFESLFGADDFGNFRQAFGVFDIGNGPEWGINIDGAGASTVASTINDDQPYNLVAKVDYPGDTLTLWVDPDLSDLEANNTAMHSVSYTNTNWASAVQINSSGSGDTEWDNLAVAREWVGLNKAFAPNPGEGGPKITSFVVNGAGTGATVTFNSFPGASYTIQRSNDLGEVNNWVTEQEGVASGGSSTVRNITFLVGPPQRQFFRILLETP
jgi:hypothetical protein